MSVNYFDLVTKAGSEKNGAYNKLTPVQKASITMEISGNIRNADTHPLVTSDSIGKKISNLAPEIRAKLNYITEVPELTGGDISGEFNDHLTSYLKDEKTIGTAFANKVRAEKEAAAQVAEKKLATTPEASRASDVQLTQQKPKSALNPGH